MAQGYSKDLAYIHDAGHGHFARAGAQLLVQLLGREGTSAGLVVDLGCGSGIGSEVLCAAGYDVLGIDISPTMIALARARVPRAEFRTGSCLAAKLPPCIAVTAVGEIFNFLFDRGNSAAKLARLFRRVHEALRPPGLFLFDVATPGRVPGSGPQRSYRQETHWAVLVETEEDRQRSLLTRRITSFRRVGDLYRRSAEVHRLRLWQPSKVAAQLRQVGFRVRLLAGYGSLHFAPGHVGFLARKP
jgi:SAM-dependent methyltransferase